MSPIITLPENLVKKGELVIIPRSEYEELLRVSKMQSALDKGLEQSLKEAQKGKVVGPFDNARDLMKSLSAKSTK